MTEKVAGIILAAGGSSRLGTPKQLLIFQGKSLLNRAIDLAQDCQLDPIIVVLGSDHDKIAAQIVANDNLRIVINEHWQEGQSTSLIAGLAALDNEDTPVVFLLCDLPKMTPETVLRLIERYENEQPDVVMLETNGKRTPPILFSPNCFNAIRKLHGDKGARDIIKTLDARFIQNSDENLIFDVDTLEDFARLSE
jgi:molybdenum cofactor cytidylyltransferase